MTIGAYALTTLANLKAYLDITACEDDNVLEQHIDRATDFLERYCNRQLKTRSYTREIYWGNGQTRLILEQYPVTAVTRVSMGRTNAFSIKNTTATNHAVAEVTATALKLTADGGAATSLTLASYATINLLLAAVNAVSGWSATLLSTTYGTRKATDVLIRPSMYCLSPDVAYIEIPNDELSDYHLLSPTEARNYGMLYYPSGFTSGQEVFVDYVAGEITVSPALEDACLQLAAYKYRQSQRDPTLSQENLGDYGYSIRDLKEALPKDLLEEVNLFKKILI
jgi:hypothetical protein